MSYNQKNDKTALSLTELMNILNVGSDNINVRSR